MLLLHALFPCFLAIITTSCPAGQEADAALEDQFRNAVRQIATASEQLNLRVKVIGVGQRSSVMYEADHTAEELAKLKASGVDSVEYKSVREYAVRGDSRLEIGTDEDGDDYVVGCNPGYAFSLQRRKGATGYSISFLEERGLEARVEELINRTAEAGMSSILSGWTIAGERLDKLVESEEFQIKKIAEVNHEGTNLVRIDYQRRVEEVRVGMLSYGDCYIVCDPGKNWGIVEYAITSVDKNGKDLSRNEVHFVLKMVNAVPVSTEVIYTYTNQMGEAPRIVAKGSGTNEILSSDVPESDFLICAFGLPEPNFNHGFSSRFWYTTILAAVCLLGAWLIRKRKQRT